MNVQPYKWINQTEANADLIMEVLDKYCVRYKVSKKEDDMPFFFKCPDMYTIEANLDRDAKLLPDGTYGESPLSFILGKVNEHLKITKERSNLERCFNRNIVDPHTSIGETQPKTTVNTSFETIGDILEKHFKKPEKDSFWDKLKDAADNLKFWKKEEPKSILDEIHEHFKKKEGMKIIRPSATKGITVNLGDLDPNNMLKGILGSLAGVSDIGLVDSLTNGDADVVSFDDLTPEEQAKLTLEHPVELLRSSRCQIRKVQRGPLCALLVSICVDGEE
jgi:hypothetical protein